MIYEHDWTIESTPGREQEDGKTPKIVKKTLPKHRDGRTGRKGIEKHAEEYGKREENGSDPNGKRDITAYDGQDTMFVLCCHISLPVLDRDLHAGDSVIVTFTVSWYKWRKPEQDKANGKDGSTLVSPQKKAAEGYQMAVSLNIQDVILMEANEEHIMAIVPVTNPVDESELM
ncbi:hypothetical protein M422DRAFT_272362 [Sphaerobolus stellatus SS14]|uniref:Uncharacterized protein n=1 Tax=Sphaerobolus stellatus (strain SS14) TaxID=990650 RepID=A0A0C9UBQ9_SPHS4|nr:hypothetical protein M422DRAFT_272362 [Sphaerobolus stellatus SS14]